MTEADILRLLEEMRELHVKTLNLVERMAETVQRTETAMVIMEASARTHMDSLRGPSGPPGDSYCYWDIPAEVDNAVEAAIARDKGEIE